jgi:hypothetical protein
MGRIDDAIGALEATEDGTERALHLAGLITTLFKIKGVGLVVTGQLAYDVYASSASERPELELAAFAGDLAPRSILEIMRGQLHAHGSLYKWTVAGIPVGFHHDAAIANRDLCREFTTDHGVVKLLPVEEITADRILAAVYPEPDPEVHAQAHQLLINGLADVFQMDWTALHTLCHRPDYRVGEELAKMRLAAKKDVDAMGAGRDHVGEMDVLPSISAPPAEDAPGVESADTMPVAADEIDVATIPPAPDAGAALQPDVEQPSVGGPDNS